MDGESVNLVRDYVNELLLCVFHSHLSHPRLFMVFTDTDTW